MNTMQSVIEYLISLRQKHGIRISIDFEPEPGAVYIKISLSKNQKKLSKLFYYVPVGEDTIDNFRFYNPYFEYEINKMISDLEE